MQDLNERLTSRVTFEHLSLDERVHDLIVPSDISGYISDLARRCETLEGGLHQVRFTMMDMAAENRRLQARVDALEAQSTYMSTWDGFLRTLWAMRPAMVRFFR